MKCQIQLKYQPYKVVLLICSLLLIYSCKHRSEKIQPVPESKCQWDKIISGATVEEIKTNWSNKWENIPYGDQVPDRFYVNRLGLEILVTEAQANCGFRAYYALTRPGDLTSMGLVFTAIDTNLTDQVRDARPGIIFSNITSEDELKVNDYKDSIEVPLKYISLDTAITYTRNWREYNEVCLQNDILGNEICPRFNLERSIPPRGNLNSDITQLVPLGINFTGLESFRLVQRVYPDAKAFVFYNCMYPLTKDEREDYNLNSDSNLGYRYDLYIEGYGIMGSRDFLKSGSSTEAVDITGRCPPECNNEKVLQSN